MILDDPYDDPKGLVIPDRSPEPTKEQLDVSLLSPKSLCSHFKYNKDHHDLNTNCMTL